MDHGVDRLPTSHIYSKTYVEAAHHHALLCGRLLTSNECAASAILDINYALMAAIVLQLAQLVLDVLSMATWVMNQHETAEIVAVSGAVIARLLLNHDRMLLNFHTLPPLPTHSSSRSLNMGVILSLLGEGVRVANILRTPYTVAVWTRRSGARRTCLISVGTR